MRILGIDPGLTKTGFGIIDINDDSLKLIDYGFVYRNDPWYPLDDLSWFLLKKKN